jgi:uncharacterized protein
MRIVMLSAIAAAGLTVTACGLTGTSPPSTFYLLSPIAAPPSGWTQAPRPITVLVGPVTLPKHLDRAEVVTFATPNRLQLAELDRWAEPLDENVARVLGENISRLVPTDGVAMYSGTGRSFVYDYQLIVGIPRLELSSDGRIHVTALWRLHDRAGAQIGPAHRFEHEEATEPRLEMMAAAVSRGLARLSAEIAANLAGSSR